MVWQYTSCPGAGVSWGLCQGDPHMVTCRQYTSCPGGGVSVKGVSVKGGLLSGGFCQGDPPYGNMQAVHILSRGRGLLGSLSGRPPYGNMQAVHILSREGSLSRGTGLCLGGGVSVQGDLCPRGSLSGRPPYGNGRVVRILLDCILLFFFFQIIFGT